MLPARHCKLARFAGVAILDRLEVMCQSRYDCPLGERQRVWNEKRITTFASLDELGECLNGPLRGEDHSPIRRFGRLVYLSILQNGIDFGHAIFLEAVPQDWHKPGLKMALAERLPVE